MEDKKHSELKSFSIRQMEVEDIAAVFQLGAETFTADQWPMLYRSWDEYEVTSLFNTDGEYCLVAEAEGDGPERICGFVLGTVISKPGSAWTYGYIIWLCARVGWQREGVATRLVDKLVERMVAKEGIRIIMADTDPENTRAVRFFEKMGFGDRKPHVYLSSNLEHNTRYVGLLEANRLAAEEIELPRKKKRKSPAKKSTSPRKKKAHPEGTSG
jgi:ribosomal protein S18 acetylase RimI-like enzyme